MRIYKIVGIIGFLMFLIGVGSFVYGSYGQQDNGYFNYNQVYASLSTDDDAGTIALTTQNVYYGWTGASSTISVWSGTDTATGTTATGATSTIVIGKFGGGMYHLAFSSSISINAPNETVHCAIFKNGVKYHRAAAESKLGSGTDVVGLSSAGGDDRLFPGDVIDLRCKNNSSGGKVLMLPHVSFDIVRISM